MSQEIASLYYNMINVITAKTLLAQQVRSFKLQTTDQHGT